jgi:hypothetical protein
LQPLLSMRCKRYSTPSEVADEFVNLHLLPFNAAFAVQQFNKCFKNHGAAVLHERRKLSRR